MNQTSKHRKKDPYLDNRRLSQQEEERGTHQGRKREKARDAVLEREREREAEEESLLGLLGSWFRSLVKRVEDQISLLVATNFGLDGVVLGIKS
ncbi:hypothetical protein ACJRO7_014267 [Eucalyptus globulus]|uniref:Uncharacterized protein n=1 Tax=Eucalyptus globulus TaxID=34317 RepID=A0ABD3KZJ9_EUCGL